MFCAYSLRENPEEIPLEDKVDTRKNMWGDARSYNFWEEDEW